MNYMTVRAIVILTVFGLGFGAGWRIKNAFVAERDLAIAKAAESYQKDFREHESTMAKVLDDKLKNLKANERVVIREIPKIITRDVYRNQCLDDDGVRLIERARRGETDTKQPPQ